MAYEPKKQINQKSAQHPLAYAPHPGALVIPGHVQRLHADAHLSCVRYNDMCISITWFSPNYYQPINKHAHLYPLRAAASRALA